MLKNSSSLIKTHSKGHFRKNQQLYHDFQQLPDDLFNEERIKSIPILSLQVLCYLLKIKSLGLPVHPGQKRIGHKAGYAMGREKEYCTRHIRRALKVPKDLGLLKIQRRFNNSSVYHLHPALYDSEICLRLSKYVPGFKFFFLFFLWSTPAFTGDVRLENNLFINSRAVSPYMTSQETSKSNFASYSPFLNQSPGVPCRLRSKTSSGPDPSKTYFVGYRDILSTPPKDGTAKTNFEESGPPGNGKTDNPPQRSVAMSDFSPTLDHLKSFKLTQWGKIRLSGFPEVALRHADGRTSNKQNLQDPFSWFFSICLGYCRENSLRVNWDRVDRLKREMNMPEKPEFIEKRNTPVGHKGHVAEQSSSPRRAEWTPPVKKELTFEDKVRDEMKYMGMEQSEQYTPVFQRLPADPEVRAAAEFLGPIAPPTSQEIDARIEARKNAWRLNKLVPPKLCEGGSPQPITTPSVPEDIAPAYPEQPTKLTYEEFEINDDDYEGVI